MLIMIICNQHTSSFSLYLSYRKTAAFFIHALGEKAEKLKHKPDKMVAEANGSPAEVDAMLAFAKQIGLEAGAMIASSFGLGRGL